MATISFNTIFDTNQRKFRIQDTSNYAGQSISLSNVKGVVKLTSPRGVSYQNTNYNSPNVNPATSLYSGYISLPTNAQGFILSGAYSVQYSVLNSSDNSVSTQINSYTYNFIVPDLSITQTVDGYNSTFVSSDTTVYGSYSSLTRTHEVTPPSGSPLSVTSNGNAIISYTANIWSGIWTTQLTSSIVYIEGDGLIIDVSLTKTQSATAYLNDMNVIRNYIETFKLLFESARATNKNLAYRIEISLIKIDTSYTEYDLALFYNDLQTAYLRTVDIVNELSDYITITFPEEIIPFVNSQGGGSGHAPVSIGTTGFGVTINTSQVLSFSLATNVHAGMVPQLSGNINDYFGGDGGWHSFASGGYALKSDFTNYNSVAAITTGEITNWNAAYGWGNHASAGYAVANYYYSKTDLQTSGLAFIHWNNITNTPTTLAGYNISDALSQNTPITPATHTKITYDSKGLITSGVDLIASDIPDLPWSKLTSGVPTTIAGYGITDVYTKTEIGNLNWDWSHITTGLPTTLAGYGIVDSYTQAQINALTWSFTTSITSKPTTLAGYGITDALSTSSAAANVISSGLGTLFLTDDGTYKPITLAGISDTQVVFIDGTTPSGNAGFLFDKTNVRLSSTQVLATNFYVENTSTGLSKDISNNLVLTDTISGSITLASIIGGATNYWTTTTGGIYYTNYVGINNPIGLTEALTVNGNVEATDFNSSYFRYKNSNILIGPNAGDQDTGSNKVYIANTNTSTPVFYAELDNQLINMYADVYILGTKTLNFGSAAQRVYENTGNLTFQDSNADSGNPITLSDLRDGTHYSLVSAFTDYNAVKSITAGNKTTWNKASVIVTTGSASNYLGQDGAYHTASTGGVTPTDYTWKFDNGVGNIYYRPYTDKTEAGGVSSGGKFYGGTSAPTNTNRLNYDGNFWARGINYNAVSSYYDGTNWLVTGNAITGNTLGMSILVGGNTLAYQKFSINPTVANTSGNSAYIFDTSNSLTTGVYRARFYNNGSNPIDFQYDGSINIPTGASFKINGTALTSGIIPIDGIFDWDGTAYNPYSTQTTGKFDNSSTDPIHTTRLNYDGYFYSTQITGFGSGNFGVRGYSDSNIGVQGSSSSNSGIFGTSDTGHAALFQHATTNTSPSYSVVRIERGIGGTSNVSNDILDIIDSPTTSGTISGSILKATIGSTVKLDMNPRVADGPTAVAYTFDTLNTLSNISAQLLKIKHAGNDYFTFSSYGNFVAIGAILSGNSTNGSALLQNGIIRSYVSGYTKMSLEPNIADGVSAVAYTFDTHNNLTTTGSKLISIKCQGTEYAYVANDGRGNFASLSAGNYGTSYSSMTSNAFQTYVYSGTSILRLSLNSTVADSSYAIPYFYDTSNALVTTGAKLSSWQNNGTEKIYFDKDGNGIFNNLYAGLPSSNYSLIGSTSISIYNGSTKMALTPAVTDSSTAIAYKFDTVNTLSTTGAKMASLVNNGLEVSSIDKDGYYYIGNSSIDGCWRFALSGVNLQFQRLESGSWVMKAEILA